STRNAAVGEIYRSVDQYCTEAFMQLLKRAAEEGKIAPSLDLAVIADAINVIGDGVFYRRAIDPTFDIRPIMPVLMGLISSLLNPTTPAQTDKADELEV